MPQVGNGRQPSTPTFGLTNATRSCYIAAISTIAGVGIPLVSGSI